MAALPVVGAETAFQQAPCRYRVCTAQAALLFFQVSQVKKGTVPKGKQAFKMQEGAIFGLSARSLNAC